MHPYDWIIGGLAFDLFGGIVLAKGFIFKGALDAWRESKSYAGANSFYIKSALHQKGEAVVGGSLLTLGFCLQMWGAFHGAPQANTLGWIHSGPRLTLVLIATGLIAGGAMWRAHAWAKSRVLRIFFRHYKEPDSPIDTKKQGQDLDVAAALVYLRRRHGESDDALRTRIENQRRTYGKKYAGRETAIP